MDITAFAHEVQFDYDRLANFGAYKRYQWVETNPVQVGDQLLDKNIKRAWMRNSPGRVCGGLRVEIWSSTTRRRSRKKSSLMACHLDHPGGAAGATTRVTSSTIEIGKLVIALFDPATKQLVSRGSASKTLDINEDPDKNYRNLEKAVAKLFKNYPPDSRKR